ncbi:AAA family ATPase [Colletotrichum plurivorum]|uniref:AAA family ATPase n=1 Tax=Colletotrichum plurivorum TaxID=2175906 RepID=A0A8H6ND83_9PEZI|nr:AAA family ATPase [Colletotrichum plurivorum]
MASASTPQLSQGSTMSAAGGENIISEDQPHLDLESETTTPSASPVRAFPFNSRHNVLLMLLQEKFRDAVDPVTSDQPAKDSEQSPQDDDVDTTHTDEDNAEVASIANRSETGSESSSSVSSVTGFNYRLHTIARALRTNPDFSDRDLASDNENLELLMQHTSLMTWLSKLLRGPDHPRPSIEAFERLKGIPEMKLSSWKEWNKVPRNLPQDPRYAIDVLVEDPPIPGLPRLETSEENPSASIKLSVRPDGIPTLPSQISIYSLPIRRMISDMADGRFRSDGIISFMNISRPFKILVYLEDKIRQRVAELHKLFAESIASPTRKPPADRDTEGHSISEGNVLGKTDAATEDDVESTRSQEQSDHNDRDRLIFTHGYWNQLAREELEEAAQDFEVLVSFMDKYIFPLRKALRDTDDARVSFRELWHLYTPGTIVYVKESSVPQKLWRVIQVVGGTVPFKFDLPPPPGVAHDNYLKLGGATGENRTPAFTLDCYYVDFNGTNYVRVLKSFEIDEFQGSVHVQGLPILPFRVATSEGLVDTNAMQERGIEFISYTQQSYCYFRGRSLSYEPNGQVLNRPEGGTVGSVAVLSESIESPVVVDFERCFNTLPDWKPCRVSKELTVLYPDARLPPPPYDDDRVWDLRMAEQVLSYTDQTQSIEIYGRQPPSEDDVLLLPNRVFAYVLRTRRWACIPIGAGAPGIEGNSLTRMKADHAAWDSLQIDERHRSIIKSMMATHFRKKKSERRQFDLIQDKETVAQFYNKPLLPITCGDLGMTPGEVETNLQSSFQLAQAWECVLLLDEADVFLAERSQDNIERNALVSGKSAPRHQSQNTNDLNITVFLRVMEYYEGILFLTTNKVGSFDEAFKSRMSMALYYPPLTLEQTEKIWEMQMDRTERLSSEAAAAADGGPDESQLVRFNRLDIKALAKELWGLQQSQPHYKPVWNGRQIRNAFQTAVALAEFHRQPKNGISGPVYVGRADFEKVARVSSEFNAYLWEVKHRRGDSDMRLKQQHRFDRFDSSQFGPGFGQHQQSTGFGMPGVWDTSQSSNTMGFGGGPGFGGNGMQNQSWQHPGFGGMGIPNVNSSMGNPGMGNSGMSSIVMGGSGLGNSGMNMGNQGMGNAAMSSGMPGTVNVQAMPGQNMSEQQQQQQQQQPSSISQQGGHMQGMFGQGNAQQRSSGW